MGNLTRLDDRRVQNFVDWAEKAAPHWLQTHGAKDTSSPAAIHYAAWQLLKVQVRGDALHRYDQDYEAAAAEHYMYIRYVASVTGDPYCTIAPAMYAAKKFFDQLRGKLQSGQAQGSHPVLKANPYVVSWGQRGVSDGLNDYKQMAKGAPYRYGSAVDVLARFSFSAPTAQRMGEYASYPLEVVTQRYVKAAED